MRFQQNKKPSEPFGGRDRLIVLAFLVVLAMFFGVKVWFDLQDAEARRKSEVATQESAPLAPGDLLDDEILLSPSSTEEPAGAGGLSSGPQMVASDFKSVRDNTLGVREAEIPAYHRALAVAQMTSVEEQKRAATKVPYGVLMTEPWKYRGKLISITGRVRRLLPLKTPSNPAGSGQLYDAWIFTPDSGSSPYHVVCSSIPEGIEPSELFNSDPPEVTLTGYFFKRQGYAAGESEEDVALASAPLLLASGFELVPVVQAQTRDMASDMVPWLWWFALGIGAVLAMVFWNFAASDWAFRHTRAHTLLRPQTQPDFGAVDAVPTSEMLQDLSTDFEPAPPGYLP